MGTETPEIQAVSAATDVKKPLRRDAERNRQLILAAARDLIAERGIGVTLDDIAAHAGVGVGTVYRRFPDRNALIDVLFAEEIDLLVAAGHAGLALDDPWDGLVQFLRDHLQMQQANRGFASVVMSDVHGRGDLSRAKEAIQPVASQLVMRAHDAGVIRSDLAVSDLPVLMMMFGTVLDATRHVSPNLWERFFTIMLDGLRPGATTPLPAEPLHTDEVPDVMRIAFANRR